MSASDDARRSDLLLNNIILQLDPNPGLHVALNSRVTGDVPPQFLEQAPAQSSCPFVQTCSRWFLLSQGDPVHALPA